MSVIQDAVLGAVKVVGNLDRIRFRGWRDFVQSLPDLLAIEVPTSVSGVIVGSESPDEGDRNKIWYRRDGSGAFLGTYAFQNGAWRPLYDFAPKQVIWMTGSSANLPDGFRLIEVGNPGMSSTVVNAIMNLYIPDGLGSYAYFAVEFIGY